MAVQVQQRSAERVAMCMDRTNGYCTMLTHVCSIPALVERNFMYSLLAGPPSSCNDAAATGNGGGWTMGRLGMTQGPCSENGEGRAYTVVQTWECAGTVDAFDVAAFQSNLASLISMHTSFVAVALAPASVRATATVSPILTSAEAARIRNSLESLSWNVTSASATLGASIISGGTPSVSDEPALSTRTGLVSFNEQQSFAQLVHVAAMMDTLISVLLIVGSLVGVHVFILLLWKFLANWRYYHWKEGQFTRVVQIRKKAGQAIGVNVTGGVAEVPRVHRIQNKLPPVVSA